MYSLKDRKELRNATVEEIIDILKKFPSDALVLFNGVSHGYIHVEDNKKIISFDYESLDYLEEYK